MNMPSMSEDDEVSKLVNVILLKTSDQNQVLRINDTSDRYVDYLLTNLKEKLSLIEQINVLTFDYCNLKELSTKIATSTCLINSNETSKYKCLILTSRQTCDAIELCLSDALRSHDESHIDNITEISSHLEEKFLIYCVGQSTSNRFKQIINKLRVLNPKIDEMVLIRTPESLEMKDVKEKEHKQNSKQLAKLIIDDYNSIKAKLALSQLDAYALYPCSSIRKDDLSNELRKQDITFDELTVYTTISSSKGIARFQEVLSQVKTNKCPNVLAFFSPSACDSVFGNEQLNQMIHSDITKFKFVSVGPSTTTKLKVILKDQADIYQLDEPSPQALFNTLNSFF